METHKGIMLNGMNMIDREAAGPNRYVVKK